MNTRARNISQLPQRAIRTLILLKIPYSSLKTICPAQSVLPMTARKRSPIPTAAMNRRKKLTKAHSSLSRKKITAARAMMTMTAVQDPFPTRTLKLKRYLSENRIVLGHFLCADTIWIISQKIHNNMLVYIKVMC